MNINISNTSTIPLYEQIVTQIKSQILNGSLQQGEGLPSIRNLAKELKVSIITTKRAYEELEKDGFIETVIGKGTFVSSQNTERLKEITLYRTYNLIIEGYLQRFFHTLNKAKQDCFKWLYMLKINLIN